MFQLSVGNITILPALGYALMLFAMLRLQHFEDVFGRAKRVLYVALPLGCALLGLQIYKTLIGDGTPFIGYSYVYYAVRIASEISEMLTMFFVYIGVKKIGTTAEIKSLEKHASRNMAIMGIYFVAEAVMTVLSFTLSEQTKSSDIFKISMVYPFIIGLVWRTLNLWMILTCYWNISKEE